MSAHEYTFRLDGELTIYQVGERYASLRQLLVQCSSEHASEKQPLLTIDTSELFEVDSAGLQLLVQFVRRARQADIALHWLTPSKALMQMIDLYNATQWFTTPAEVSA